MVHSRADGCNGMDLSTLVLSRIPAAMASSSDTVCETGEADSKLLFWSTCAPLALIPAQQHCVLQIMMPLVGTAAGALTCTTPSCSERDLSIAISRLNCLSWCSSAAARSFNATSEVSFIMALQDSP